MIVTEAVTTVHQFPVNFNSEDRLDFEEELTYRTLDSSIRELTDVSVTADSVVYKAGRLLRDSLAAQNLARYYQGSHFVKNWLFGKKVRLNENVNYLLATDSWSAGHFHWFCDVLPKLINLKGSAAAYTLLLPDTAYTRHVANESFTRLGLDFSDLLWLKPDTMYRVKRLFYLSPVAKSGHMNKAIIKKMQHAFLQESTGPSKKIYISRDRARFRKVINESELKPLLQQYGFDFIFTDHLSLSEQIDMFSKASVICSIHGAGLVNSFFMHPGGKMIELRRKENAASNTGYWHLCDALDHKYYYFNATPDSDQPLVGRGSNLTVGLEEFESKILKVI